MTGGAGAERPSDGATGADERRRRLRRGTRGEIVAAGLLMLKGYRIVAWRHRTPAGEIDLIAVKWRPGGRIAFVEVKRRRSMADAEAALSPRQAQRMARAAEHWLARRPRDREREMGLDAVLVVPRYWPRHLPNAMSPL